MNTTNQITVNLSKSEGRRRKKQMLVAVIEYRYKPPFYIQYDPYPDETKPYRIYDTSLNCEGLKAYLQGCFNDTTVAATITRIHFLKSEYNEGAIEINEEQFGMIQKTVSEIPVMRFENAAQLESFCTIED